MPFSFAGLGGRPIGMSPSHMLAKLRQSGNDFEADALERYIRGRSFGGPSSRPSSGTPRRDQAARRLKERQDNIAATNRSRRWRSSNGRYVAAHEAAHATVGRHFGVDVPAVEMSNDGEEGTTWAELAGHPKSVVAALLVAGGMGAARERGLSYWDRPRNFHTHMSSGDQQMLEEHGCSRRDILNGVRMAARALKSDSSQFNKLKYRLLYHGTIQDEELKT